MENQRDEKLWKQARQRVRFKRSAATYIAVNAFLWVLWYFTNKGQEEHSMFPWPAWVSLGWGFGLLMHYVRVYHSNSENEVEKEYQKLKDEQK